MHLLNVHVKVMGTNSLIGSFVEQFGYEKVRSLEENSSADEIRIVFFVKEIMPGINIAHEIDEVKRVFSCVESIGLYMEKNL